MNDIEENIRERLGYTDKVGIYATDFKRDTTIAFNEHESFFTASVSKVATAIALYYNLQIKGADDTTKIKITDRDKVGGSGILQDLGSNTYSLYDLMVLMLEISDNTAADKLIEFVSLDFQSEVIEKLGCKNTYINKTLRETVNSIYNLPKNATYKEYREEDKKHSYTAVKDAQSLNLQKANITTPYDMSLILQELVSPQLLTRRYANKILDVMKRCENRKFFEDIGYQIDISHKTGSIPGVEDDVGIVFGEVPYLFILLTKDIVSVQETQKIANEISDLVYAHFNGK